MSKFNKGFLLLVAVLFTGLVKAQTIQEGKDLLYYEKYVSAKELFQKLVDANPNNTEAVYWLGQALLGPDNNKDIAGAKALYLKTLSANSSDALLTAGVGHVELLEGKTQEARNHFETAISLSGGKSIAVLNAVGMANGDFYSKAGDANYAIQKLTQATQIKGFKDPDVYANLGDAYRKLADGGKAQQSYEAALALNPKYARGKYRIGRIYQTQGRGQEEIFMRYYNEAIALDANYTPVFYTLYQYFYETNVPKSAEYLAKYLQAKGPKDEPDGCRLTATLSYAQGLFAETVKQVDGCIAAAGANVNPKLYGLRGYAYNRLGDSVNAKLSFDEFFKKEKPADIGSGDYKTYAEILLKFPGNESLAGTFLEKAIDADSTEAGKVALIKSIASKYEAQKMYKEAADWYSRILTVKKDPGKVDLYNAGYNFNRGGAYQQSIDVFNKYIAKYPDESFGYFMNGRNFAKLDSLDASGEALKNYAKIVDMTDAIKDKPGEKDRIKSSLRYLIEFYANVRRSKDTAILYTDKGIALDPADTDFVNIKDQLSKMTIKPAATPAPPRQPAPRTTNPGTKPSGTTTQPVKPVAQKKR